MKRITILAIMALVMLSATAQEVEKRSRWGFRVTADMMMNNGADATYYSDGSFTDFNYTLLYQCFVKKNWYIEPQLSLYHMNYDYEIFFVDNVQSQIQRPASNLNEMGLGVAAVAGYNFPITKKFNIDLFLGPELKYALKCENNVGESYIKSDSSKKQYYPAYLNWKVGVGLNYKAFNLTLSGGSGFTKRLVDRTSIKMPVFISLGLGFKFHGKQ